MSPPTTPPDGGFPEVRTRRLVVTDDGGSPRIVGEVTEAGVAEFRLQLSHDAGDHASVLLFANPGDGREGPTLGLQLWAGGDSLAEMNLWREGNRWGVSSHVPPTLG
jgi:hypothetical protein